MTDTPASRVGGSSRWEPAVADMMTLTSVDATQSAVKRALPPPTTSWRSRLVQCWLFLALVVGPVVAGAIYFGVIAADRYISEAKFIVRASGAAAPAALEMLVRGETSNRVADDTHAVNAFMMSRDAAAELARDHGLRDVMARPEGDIFARFPNFYTRVNDENFFEAYRGFVDVRVEATTGITTLTVTAFRPEDAKRIAEALLNISERFVNRLRERSMRDEIAFTRNLVQEARAQLETLAERLADYRNEMQALDPQAESTNRLAGLAKLATEISQLEAALSQQSAMAPKSPTIGPMREKVRSLQDELERQRRGIVGDDGSMATKFQGYELLMVERELVGRALVNAVTRMEAARQEAQRQSLYLQRIVEPNAPDYPAGPYRIFGVLLTTACALGLFWLVRNLMRLTLEHRP